MAVSCDTGCCLAEGNADNPASKICVTLSATAAADFGASDAHIRRHRLDRPDHQMSGAAVAALAADRAGGDRLRVAQGSAQGRVGQAKNIVLKQRVQAQFIRRRAVAQRKFSGRQQRHAAVLRHHAWQLQCGQFVGLDAGMTKAVKLVEEAVAHIAKLIAVAQTWLAGCPWFVWLDSPACGMHFIQRHPDNSRVYGTPQADLDHAQVNVAMRDGFSLRPAAHWSSRRLEAVDDVHDAVGFCNLGRWITRASAHGCQIGLRGVTS